MRNWAIILLAPCSMLILAPPALGQDTARAAVSDAGQTAEPQPAACEIKKKKKKKGFGFGGVLRAARDSGLLGAVSGRAGTDGYLVGTAASTAIDLGADRPRADVDPKAEEQAKC